MLSTKPRGPLVLVVDDDRELRETLEDLLTTRGYRVVVAEDGDVAVNLLDRGIVPDLVLLDLWMPGLDGRGVAGRIRADPALASVPIVAFTGAGPEDVCGLEVDWYLQKPLRPGALLGTVAHYCSAVRDVA